MVLIRRVLMVAAVVALASGCAWVGRVGVASNGAQPNGGVTFGTDVSPNGRFVVFTSEANNLVANDTNDAADVFLRDLQTGVTERVSVNTAGTQGNIGAYNGLVSSDGRYVAFDSDSTNLVANDTNDMTDVFLRDRQLNTTTRVSLRSGGTQTNGSSYLTSMTPDAGLVVFESDADNINGTQDQNYSNDVFVRDRVNNNTKRMSVATDGTEGDLDSYGGSISDDGRYVVFSSDAYIFDEDNDSGVYTDIFIRDRQLNTTTRVTALPGGDEADGDSTNPVISGDGSVIVFETEATNLDPNDDGLQTDVYAVARGTSNFERISTAIGDESADDYSFLSGVSDDGRYVLFQSGASNLVSNALTANQNSFVRDRTLHATEFAGTTQKMAQPSAPSAALAGSTPNAISGDGRYVMFTSNAGDVVDGVDANDTASDVFLRSNPVAWVFFASPNTIARGTTGTITLHGKGLRANGALVLMGDGVAVNSVTQVDETAVDVNVTVAANAAPGPRMPLVIQSGTGAGAFTGGVTFLPNAYSVS